MSALFRIFRLVALSVVVTLALSRSARADSPRGQSIPVLAIDSEDADEQADALTTALRAHIRQTPGWTLLETNQSLSMLTAAFNCPPHPDPGCLNRIGDKLKTDQFFWGVMAKAPGHQVSVELHLWSRGKPDKVVRQSFSDNLKDANDDNLRRVATQLFGSLLGVATGTLAIHASADTGTIVVDGIPSGALVGGHASMTLAAGPHSIEVQAPGYATTKRQVIIEPSAANPLEIVLESSGGSVSTAPSNPLPVRKIAGWSAIAGGAILVAIGIGFGVAELNDQSQLNAARQGNYALPAPPVTDPCHPPNGQMSPLAMEGCNDVNSSHTALAVEISTLALGGIAAGVGIYLLATDHSGSDAHDAAPPAKTGLSSVRFFPSVGPGSGSMVVLGRF